MLVRTFWLYGWTDTGQSRWKNHKCNGLQPMEKYGRRTRLVQEDLKQGRIKLHKFQHCGVLPINNRKTTPESPRIRKELR